MRASKRLITSVIALIVSVVLCIGVCIAWFSSNKSVDGTGMSASLGMNIETFTVTAYAISGVTSAKDESGNVTGYTGTNAGDLTDGKMYAYRNINNTDTAVLLKFDYTFTQSNTKNYGIYAQLNKTVANTNNATVVETETNDTYESDLSSAVSFYSVASLDGTTVTWSASAISGDETLVTLNSVTASGTLSGTVYCVMDYDGDKISKLYTAVAELKGSISATINFTGDIEFYISETGQNV